MEGDHELVLGSPGWLSNWFCRDGAKGKGKDLQLAALPPLWLFGPRPLQDVSHLEVDERGQSEGAGRAGDGASRWLISHLLLFGRLNSSLSLKCIRVRMTHPSSQDSNLQ